MSILTVTEKRLMSYIDSYWLIHYHSPSCRELVRAGVFQSTSHINYVAGSLIEKGFLLPRPRGAARSFIPVWVKFLIDSQMERREKFLPILKIIKAHPSSKNRASV